MRLKIKHAIYIMRYDDKSELHCIIFYLNLLYTLAASLLLLYTLLLYSYINIFDNNYDYMIKRKIMMKRIYQIFVIIIINKF